MDVIRYVPTLRWKQAERESLLHLSDKSKAVITPLIDFLMPQPSPFTKQKKRKTAPELLKESKGIFEKNLPGVAETIQKHWGNQPIFVDVSFIDAELRSASLKQMLSGVALFGNNIIPVITLGSDKETIETAVSLVKKTGQGLCLRLFRGNFDTSTLSSELESFLTQNKLSRKDVDLVIDFKIWNDRCAGLENLLNALPNIDEWRTLTFLSGSFPPDLSEFELGLNQTPRLEWTNWKAQVESGKLSRNPSFGDYTILHPIYREPVTGANPSASIRYTLEDKWLIMRGQGLRSEKGAGYAQYPAQAKLLMGQPEFFGETFSYGDSYIAEKGANIGTDKPGSTTTWLRAGINHHLECTAKQFANMGANKGSL